MLKNEFLIVWFQNIKKHPFYWIWIFLVWLLQEEIRLKLLGIISKMMPQENTVMVISKIVLENAIWIPWVLVPVTIIILLALTFFESKKEVTAKNATIAKPPKEFVEFFKDRPSLAARASYDEIFNPKNSVYAWFVSGEGIFSKNEKHMDHVKQILLPRPDTPGLETFGRVQGSDFHTAETVSDNIKKVTRLAKAKKKDVRWFKGFNGYGITFCNPGEKNAWLHCELIMPGVPPEERSAIRIERSSQEKAYDNIYHAFEKMWNDAEVPEPYEYEKKGG